MERNSLQEDRLRQAFTLYPVLEKIEHENPGVFTKHMMFRTMEVDEPLVTCTSKCQDMIFLLKGEIKIVRLSETGEETNLYNIKVGEVCHEYFRCLIDQEPFNIVGRVLQTSIVAVIPLSIVRSYMMRNADFLTFMYQDLHRKLNHVISSKEDKLHTSLENRIVKYLRKRNSTRVYATHQEIALETDAAREAVSRKLKELEAAGYIKLGRGVIELLVDPSELDQETE